MKILAVAEQRNGSLRKAGCETIRAARTVADQIGGEVIAVTLGPGAVQAAPTAGGYGAHRSLACEDPKLSAYAPSAYASAVAQAARAAGAQALFISATSQGKDYAPRVAVKLEAGFIPDCTLLKVDQGAIVATRPVYAGKAFTDVKVTTSTGVYTLRPNVFTAGLPSGSTAPTEAIAVTLTDGDVGAVVKETKQSTGKLDVAEADIIVSGGRGLKGPENFAMIEELASALGAAVGASRAVVDAGWRPHDEQVGQTGKTVSPSLYVAVAISGAIQHLAGMSSSKYIVAINKDKDAPIFQVADYGIVGDAFEVVPALTREVKALRGK